MSFATQVGVFVNSPSWCIRHKKCHVFLTHASLCFLHKLFSGIGPLPVVADSHSHSPPPSFLWYIPVKHYTIIIMMSADITEEYERAVAFLRNFHSRPAVTSSSASSSPLGAINESGSDKSMSDAYDGSRMGQSTRLRKTTTSTCLADLNTPFGLNSFSSCQ